ncbi:hypothetical protein ACP275_08G092600 [Erythranthe tilingii]
MGYLEIFLAIILCCFILLFLLLPSTTNINYIYTLLPWNWPFMKLMPTAYLKSHKLYDKITDVLSEHNGTVLFNTSWFTNLDILVTSDPVNVQHVMNSKFTIYQRGTEFRKAFDFLGDAAFIKDLDEWKEDKKFTHAFYKEIRFQKSIPETTLHTLEKALIPVLDHVSSQNQVVDLQGLFHRYMLDATCLMATGSDLGSLRVGFPDCPLLDAMDDVAEAVFWRQILPERVWRMQRWLNIGKEKKMGHACVTLNRILAGYVSGKKREDDDDDESFDVLKFYMDEASTEKQTGNAFLAANLMTLLFAGRDTSAALLTWFFYLVSKNPSVENAILEEIGRSGGGDGTAPGRKHVFFRPEELSKLVYLQCALMETLRLFPTAPVIIRDPNREDVLPSGQRVFKKTKVVLCTYAMGRSPEIWGEDCGEFKPERWMCGGDGGGGGVNVKHVGSNSFLAFGSGPWACPGKEVAFARLKGVAATILHNYHVHVSEGQTASPSVSALLTMRHGLKATLSNRSM